MSNLPSILILWQSLRPVQRNMHIIRPTCHQFWFCGNHSGQCRGTCMLSDQHVISFDSVAITQAITAEHACYQINTSSVLILWQSLRPLQRNMHVIRPTCHQFWFYGNHSGQYSGTCMLSDQHVISFDFVAITQASTAEHACYLQHEKALVDISEDEITIVSISKTL